MRRLSVLSLLLLAVDQTTKTVAQLTLAQTSQAQWRACRESGLDCARELADIVFAPGWGLTYTQNPTLYVWADAPAAAVNMVHLLVLVAWAWFVFAAGWYLRRHRASLPVELAVGFLTVAAWGNLIDRLVVGGARDWLASPWWVTNLADASALLVLPLLAFELLRYPPARQLKGAGFALDPRRWPHPGGPATGQAGSAEHDPEDRP